MNTQGSRGNGSLISYDIKASPRANGEVDVKNQIENLTEGLRGAHDELKEYKKMIEAYRSEIGGM